MQYSNGQPPHSLPSMGLPCARCVPHLPPSFLFSENVAFCAFSVVSLHFTRLAFDLKQINHRLCVALAFKCCAHTHISLGAANTIREIALSLVRRDTLCVCTDRLFLHSHDVYLVAICLHFYSFAVVHHSCVAEKAPPTLAHSREFIETKRDGIDPMGKRS